MIRAIYWRPLAARHVIEHAGGSYIALTTTGWRRNKTHVRVAFPQLPKWDNTLRWKWSASKFRFKKKKKFWEAKRSPRCQRLGRLIHNPKWCTMVHNYKENRWPTFAYFLPHICSNIAFTRVVISWRRIKSPGAGPIPKYILGQNTYIHRMARRDAK